MFDAPSPAPPGPVRAPPVPARRFTLVVLVAVALVLAIGWTTAVMFIAEPPAGCADQFQWGSLAWNVAACMTVVSLLLCLLAGLAIREDRMRVELHAALQHSAEVKRRQAQNRMNFLAHMSHELRTPLNAIIGFAEILSTEMLGPIGNPKYKDCVNDIHDSGRHLLRVINDVLDVAKIDAGKMKLNAYEFDACAVVREVSRMLAGLARKAQLALVTETPADAILLHADERLLRQMLINLIGNAIKFTPAGGEVCVRDRGAGPARRALQRRRHRRRHRRGRPAARARPLRACRAQPDARRQRHRPRPAPDQGLRRAAPRRVRHRQHAGRRAPASPSPSGRNARATQAPPLPTRPRSPAARPARVGSH